MASQQPILHVFSKVNCRGATVTHKYTIARNLVELAQKLQELDEDAVEEALDEVEEKYNIKDYDTILLMQAIAQPWRELEDKDNFLGMLNDDGYFGVEGEETTWGIGTSPTTAKVAFAEVYED